MKTLCLRSFVTLLAVGLVGCSGGTSKPLVPPPAGVVKSFTAAPTALAAPGDKTTLKWETQDATTVTLEQVGKGPLAIDAKAASGTLEVALAKDALFVLSARGEGGTDALTAAVTVGGGGQGVVFDAVPRTIVAGATSTLVWSAPGATAVSIKPMGGTDLNLGGQVQSGSIRVSPTASTQYVLTADGKTATVDVTVGIAIFTFTADGAAPAPGKPVALSWTTSGGASLTLKRAGTTAALVTETDPAKIAAGNFVDTVAADAPVDGLLSYTLELSQGADKVSRPLTVRIGGSVTIDQFLVPAYVRSGASFIVQWKTTGAERLELWVDDVLVFLAPDAAATSSGNRPVPVPATGSVKVKVKASNTRGALAELEKTATVVGLPTFNTFTADKTTIAAGGEPVVLSWNVSNARHVRITENGSAVYENTGMLDTGMATVFPNRAVTTYTLNADNGAGDAIAPQTLPVAVTTPAILTFGAKVPVNGQSTITGHTVTGGTTLVGLPNVKKNAPGDAFVDISATGTPTGVSGDDTAGVVNIGPFNTRLFGRPVSTDSVSVSPNGFLVFNTAAQNGPSSPTTPIGAQLYPLAVAVAYKDLNCVSGTCKINWRIDTVADEQRLIIQWTDVGIYLDDASISTFQVQLYTRGKVVLAYSKIAPNLTGFGVGVVNSSNTDVLAPAMLPVNGDAFTFFTETTPPVPVKIEATPYAALVKVAAGWVEVEGNGLLSAGQIGVSEINPRPAAAVTNGQWVEVSNYTSAPFDLNGWTLDLGGGVTHTIATSVVIPANGRVLLAQASDLGQPGAGITANYVYGPSFTMAATGSLTLTISATPYSKFVWDAVSAPALGVSVRGDAPNPKNLYAGGANQSICPSTGGATWGAAAQVGTPGAANPICYPYSLSQLDGGSFESIADGGTPVVLGDAGTTGTDEKVYTVALGSPVKYFGQSAPTIYVGTNGWISTVSTTVAGLTNRTLPANTAPVGTVAPFWDDLQGNNPSPTSGIYTLRRDPDGTPGNGDEYTIVSWEDWRCYAATQSLNFQVKFFDNGNIEYHYGSMTGAATTTQGSGATAWLEDPLGKTAAPISVNSATAPGIKPNTAFRFSYVP